MYSFTPQTFFSMKNKFTLFAMMLAASLSAQSTLFIDTSYTLETMLGDFFGNGSVTISNVIYQGANYPTFGYFEAATTDMGTEAGIVFSTGDVTTLPGPVTTFASSTTNAGTDDDLALLAGGLVSSYDAAFLEMDITSTSDTLMFKYVFGSEEYPEYTCSTFNDVFAFLVSGPGLDSVTNIAAIPGTNLPVAINNLYGSNATSCPQPSPYASLYVDNEANIGQHCVLDGFTTELPATLIIMPGETYHVKIAIADIGDSAFDSAVFLSIESLDGDSLLVPPATINLVVNNENNTIEIQNDSRYATSYNWDFGDGTTSTERHPGTHQYTAPGQYTVTLITQNYCCSDTAEVTVQVGVTGIVETAQNFKVSPNPMHDQLRVEWTDVVVTEYMMTDATGRVMMQGKHNGNTLLLNTSDLPKGVYYLSVLTPQGRSVRMVTKQ